MLGRFFALVAEIEKFLQEKNPTLSTRNGASAVKLLSDHEWFLDLAFLVNITQHLNFKVVNNYSQNCSML